MTPAGERIRRVRELRRLTQTELAERAGMSPTTVKRIENGISQRTKNIDRLLTVLGLPTDEALDREARSRETPPPPAPASPADPPLSQASFVQLWVRMGELWRERTGESLLGFPAANSGPPPPPPPQLLADPTAIAVDDEHEHDRSG